MKKKKGIGEAFAIDPNITMGGEFDIWWNKVKPAEFNEESETSHRNAYYAGAANMGYIMSQLAKGRPAEIAGAIVDRLFEEIQNYFLDNIERVEDEVKQTLSRELPKETHGE